jgi:hypothetical protein
MSILSGVFSLGILIFAGLMVGSLVEEIRRDSTMRRFHLWLVAIFLLAAYLALHDNKMPQVIDRFRQPFGITDGHVAILVLGGGLFIGGVLGFCGNRIKAILGSFCSSQEAES